MSEKAQAAVEAASEALKTLFLRTGYSEQAKKAIDALVENFIDMEPLIADLLRRFDHSMLIYIFKDLSAMAFDKTKIDGRSYAMFALYGMSVILRNMERQNQPEIVNGQGNPKWYTFPVAIAMMNAGKWMHRIGSDDYFTHSGIWMTKNSGEDYPRPCADSIYTDQNIQGLWEEEKSNESVATD